MALEPTADEYNARLGRSPSIAPEACGLIGDPGRRSRHRTFVPATFRALHPEFQAGTIAREALVWTAGENPSMRILMSMRILILIVFWLAAAQGHAAAQAAAVAGITITKVGTYTAQSTSAPAGAGQQSPTNTVGTDTDWHFVSEGADVPAKVGTRFGIEFRLDGTPPGERATLHMVLTFPPQGIRNPNTGERLYNARIAFPDMKIGALCLLGYGFDNDWEIVPGVWTEQIWYQDRMLAERSFTVGKAE